MGIWGHGIFDSDTALDVKDVVFEEALDEGLNIRQASQRVLEYFAQDIEDDISGPFVYMALAGLQMQYEDLQPEIRSKVIAIILDGSWLKNWEESPGFTEWQQVLEQFRWILSIFPEPP